MNIEKAKESLITYLKRDKKGLRRGLLSILLNGEFTIPEIQEKLNEMGFFRVTPKYFRFSRFRIFSIVSNPIQTLPQ
jgi:hypothetical protein